MKKRFVIIAIVVVLMCVGVYQSRRRTTVPAVTPSTPDGTYCYARTQTATPDAPYEVAEQLKLTIAGGAVTGTKSGTQRGPDMTNGYQGTLTGSIAGTELDLTYTYTIEGASQKEQELYSVVGSKLIKHRYTLFPSITDKNLLIPDMTTSQQLVTYTAERCE